MSNICQKPRYELGVTLADGTAHTFKVAKLPRHWKSWVMQQLPYGTELYGHRGFIRREV